MPLQQPVDMDLGCKLRQQRIGLAPPREELARLAHSLQRADDMQEVLAAQEASGDLREREGTTDIVDTMQRRVVATLDQQMRLADHSQLAAYRVGIAEGHQLADMLDAQRGCCISGDMLQHTAELELLEARIE